ncbi:MAG TPA: DUF4118 domain-containing protein, partial [Terrimicrobiaceae bacterium]|nr:DUF4118 domain-containing protein [Terrimicrobiaceae bacterium]
PYSGHLIRWTRRVATLTHGTWTAVFIDTGRPLDDAAKARLEKNLNLARSLGAEVLTTTGDDVTGALLRVGREHNVTQIVVGKPLTHPVLDFLSGGSLVDKLIRRSGDIDIYVVRAEKEAPRWRPDFSGALGPQVLRECGIAVLIVLCTTVLGLMVRPHVGYMAVGLVYLLSVLLGSMFLSRWPILLAGALTALAWNFLFISPYGTFYISNLHDVILFGLYFAVALVMGHLNTRLRQRERAERRREEQATALYQFSRDIVTSNSLSDAIREGTRHIEGLFGVGASVLAGPGLELAAGEPANPRELAVARWALEKKAAAGRFTDTLPQAEATYLPLRAGERVAGVLAIRSRMALGLAERQLLETFAAQIALLIERARLTREAEAVKVEERSRRLQKTLLDSVSHEFKTPLSVIAAATERLFSQSPDPLVAEIRIAAERLQRIVASLLDITRIETGTVRPRTVWCEIREVVDRSSHRLRHDLAGHRLAVRIADNASACLLDPGLLEEILCNLLRNAAQHGPPDSPIEVTATAEDGLVLRVADCGPGLAEEDAARIFEKFQRGAAARPGGLGLGLSIVRGFAEAHGGRAEAGPRTDGQAGAEFRIFLPVPIRSTDSIKAAL